MRFFLILIAFFSFSFANNLQLKIKQEVIEQQLFNSHVWYRLLHLDSNAHPTITSPEFLLSHTDFSPKNELEKTIDLFFENPENACKYPARYAWLKQKLQIDELELNNCQEFNEYIAQTNMENLKLVYVSEQVKNPISMMGHVFFKIEGKKDSSANQKQHAVSFFTVIDSMNIPYLAIQSTLIGMKGYFVVSPYKSQIDRYLKVENRNIWEYDLNLTNDEKKLIYYHFWELKDVDIVYLFTGFNCATIVDDMVGIANADYKKSFSLWVTPQDVIKKAKSHNLLNSFILIPSATWELNMLSETLSSSVVKEIKEILDNKKFNEIKTFKFSENIEDKKMELSLFEAYSEFLNESSFEFNNSEVRYVKDLLKNDDTFIDLSNYKNPLNTSQDSQISIAALSGADEGITLRFLPASNKLYDDNREYFTESTLTIGEATLHMTQNNISLESLNVFSFQSFVPWNNLTQNFSSDFKLSYENHYNSYLDPFKSININGGMGISQKFYDDIILYGLLDFGLAYGNGKIYPYYFPQIGLMIYEVLGMKSIFEYSFVNNQGGTNSSYHNFGVEHSIFFDKNYRIGLSYKNRSNSKFSFDTFSASLNYYF